MATPMTVRHISRCIIKPKCLPEESKQIYHLNPWDISLLSVHYIQAGLLFPKPTPVSINQEDHRHGIPAIIDQLKDSLSRTLVHFIPLTGRFITQKSNNPHSYSISVDCRDAPGAEFIHAVADLKIADVLSPIDVPPIVHSFFAFNGVVNHDGHTMPLLAVQVTELLDGIFMGCSFNHAIGDGASFWHFINTWSELCREKVKDKRISLPPIILERWFPNGHGPIVNLPFSDHSEFIIEGYNPPKLRERFFHFSAQTMARLKAKANAECNITTISSLQALSALLWRATTQARRLDVNQTTNCTFVISNRPRLNPPLSPNYFGTAIQAVSGTTTVGELLSRGLGWAALILHQAVARHTDSVVREQMEANMVAPFIYYLRESFDPCSVMVASSPRFDMYGNDFGWGEPMAVRCGPANKFGGMVFAHPGKEGGGSVDLEVCLPPEEMGALESIEEFMEAVSPLIPLSHSTTKIHQSALP
ncbi:PREDICTED: uncharacterized acetyltransferase At3g50280-like [Nelumbo nucifera]|uniref:Uncharacterized protein n=2 Tax=Nelumbo nucifera TaxID=4432 RepID=A0A822YXN7_NELNU|nr:PREDICTED: uncharacterized acetyltransferase At3g50280-like [Nelumbo nucifera]DAD38834.1 TPA_asm: hypothetical protein HUJ06_013156 [Nelumbo nucifera]